MNWYLYEHTKSDVFLVELLKEPLSPIFGISLQDFLNYKGDSNLTNRERIKNYFDTEDEKNQLLNTIDENLIVKYGIKLYVKRDLLNVENLIYQNKNVIRQDSKQFIASKLFELLQDKSYIPIAKNVNQLSQNIKVYIWCRSLNFIEANNESNVNNMKGRLINITPFIQGLNLQTNKNLANFNFNIAPIKLKNNNGDYALDDSEFFQYFKTFYSKNVSFIAYNNIDANSQYFFSKLIIPNDLIYIKFESLEIEKDKNQETFEINKSEIKNNIWDCIGLIDSITETKVYSNSQIQIQIQGRSLSKVFFDDGCYFFPLEYAQGIYANTSKSEARKLLNRIDGKILTYGSFVEKTIEQSVQFVINQLANLGYVPNNFFDFYEDSERNKFFQSNEEDVKRKQNKFSEIEDNKKVIVNDIKKLRKTNNLTNSNPINENAICINIYNDIESLIQNNQTFSNIINNKVLRDKLYLFEGDINAELIINDSSTNSNDVYFYSIYNQIRINNINKENALNVQINPSLEYMNGVYQIIDLLIDDNVKNRLLVDSSISVESGAIINFFNKIINEPFIEYILDTYKDRFVFMIRKPPFDFEGIINYDKPVNIITEKKDRLTIEDRYNLTDRTDYNTLKSLIINIDENLVKSENLSFFDGEVYSIYILRPKAIFYGDSEQISLAYFPAIFFEEYAEIFGSRPYDISYNYNVAIPYNANKEKSENSYLLQQCYLDLKYLIESTCYLPFTRQGSIVINGDRRIKVGQWIRYKKELFYVDSVSHSYNSSSVERTTTINVSRGMVEKYIKNTDVGYFNIINLSLNFEFLQNYERILQNWKVNRNVFNFFLTRRQFLD